MTSSDLLDTSLAILCKEAGELILTKLKKFHLSLRKSAKKYREIIQIGRSHGVHAEPITFGFKFALWSEEIDRSIIRWENALENISFGKILHPEGTLTLSLEPLAKLSQYIRAEEAPEAVSQ